MAYSGVGILLAKTFCDLKIQLDWKTENKMWNTFLKFGCSKLIIASIFLRMHNHEGLFYFEITKYGSQSTITNKEIKPL